MSIEDLKRTEKEKAVFRAFIENPYQFLVISGANGTGKTYAARNIYETLCPRLHTRNESNWAIFTKQTELNMKFSEGATKAGWTNYLLKDYQATKLLVLDDVGTRIPSDAFMDFLYDLVDNRYDGKKPTIITTNLNAKEMRAKFSDAFFSRCCSGLVIRVEGKDLRFEEKDF